MGQNEEVRRLTEKELSDLNEYDASLVEKFKEICDDRGVSEALNITLVHTLIAVGEFYDAHDAGVCNCLDNLRMFLDRVTHLIIMPVNDASVEDADLGKVLESIDKKLELVIAEREASAATKQ